jgi:hypothetical protein
MYDGLNKASDMFVQHTINRFEQVKMLHIILLVATLVLMLAFLLLLFRPYYRKLHAESKTIAGLLSQLPNEVDVEGHVKTVVFGITKAPQDGAKSLTGAEAMMPGMMSFPGAAGAGKGGWGFGKNSTTGAAGQMQMMNQQQMMMMMAQQQQAMQRGSVGGGVGGRGWGQQQQQGGDEDAEEGRRSQSEDASDE